MSVYVKARGGQRRTQLEIESCLEEAGRKGWKHCSIEPDYIGWHVIGYFLNFA